MKNDNNLLFLLQKKKNVYLFLGSLCQPPRSAITINKNVVLSNWTLSPKLTLCLSLSLSTQKYTYTHTLSHTHTHTHTHTHAEHSPCRWSFIILTWGRVLSFEQHRTRTYKRKWLLNYKFDSQWKNLLTREKNVDDAITTTETSTIIAKIFSNGVDANWNVFTLT